MELQVNDRTVYAYTGGKPFNASLPCVVFVHGALHDHSGWPLLARWCAHHGHSVLALDLPGHLRSAGPALASVEEATDWLLAVLTAAGVERAALVGHSMGSLMVLEAAARAPQRASHLVLLGTAYPMPVAPALLETALAEPLRAIDQVNAWCYAGLAAKPSFPGPGVWLHGANRALMRRIQGAYLAGNLFHHEFSLCHRYQGGLQAAAKVACPSHFILGSADQMTPPRLSSALATALNARVHLLPAGHNMMHELPDAVLAALREALA